MQTETMNATRSELPMTCEGCKGPVANHFRNGQWIGCAAIARDVPFKLVPCRRAEDRPDRRHFRTMTHIVDRVVPASSAASDRNEGRRGAPEVLVEHTKAAYAYQLLDARRKAPAKATQTQVDVFNVLRDHCVGKPMPVAHIAALAHHPTETTRVALNTFLRRKLVTRGK